MPAYAVNAIVPLVNVNEHQGTTRAVIESGQRVKEDSCRRKIRACMLMDYCLLHGGTANH
jgi:hypothetical protein